MSILFAGQNRKVPFAIACSNLLSNRGRRGRKQTPARQECQQQQQQQQQQRRQQEREPQEESGAGRFRRRSNVNVLILYSLTIPTDCRFVVKTVQLQAVRTGQHRQEVNDVISPVPKSFFSSQCVTGHVLVLTQTPEISAPGGGTQTSDNEL